MGYRLPDQPEVQFHIDGAATKLLLCIDNGAITNLGIPCFYQNGELMTPYNMAGNGEFTTPYDIMVQDHIGWPSPDSPDDSWQIFDMRYGNINLVDEGYSDVHVSLGSDAPSGLTASGYIDSNVVRLSFKAECSSAVSSDVETTFAAYIIGYTTGNVVSMKSVVARGKLRIVANPIA